MPASDHATFRPGYVRNAGPQSKSCAAKVDTCVARMIRLSIGASGACLIAANPCPICRHITTPVSCSAAKTPGWSSQSRGANAVLDRSIEDERVVIAGAGASGIACANFLLAAGVGDVTVVDSRGIIHEGREGLNPVKAELATRANKAGLRGGLAEALRGADVFVGLSGSTVPEELIATMGPRAVVFALSNPDPEIHPDVAARHAAIVATGRSDFPNQINNSLAFPGVFRGALDAGARRITEHMKMAAADAIAAVAAEDLAPDYIVPSGVDPRVAPEVAAAVAQAAKEDGVA